MLQSIIFLIISLGIILLGAELFTNGIEWFGRKLQLAEGAVGSVLAAVGTALPETMIPIIAILFARGGSNHEIGIGAILGAPLMLSTLAFFVTGLAVIIFTIRRRRTLTMHVDPVVMGRDLRSFFLVYAIAITASFLPAKPLKVLAAIFLVAAYVQYVRQTFLCESVGSEECELNPLHIHRKSEDPHLRIVVVQVLVALGFIIGGAHFFVQNLSKIALTSGISALVLATIITPIATELPEKFNSVIWIGRRKDTLALGNITGAMVFQSSIPTAIGIIFTAWELNSQALAAAIAAVAASIFAWVELKVHKKLTPWSLLVGVIFYAGYLYYTFVLNPARPH